MFFPKRKRKKNESIDERDVHFASTKTRAFLWWEFQWGTIEAIRQRQWHSYSSSRSFSSSKISCYSRSLFSFDQHPHWHHHHFFLTLHFHSSTRRSHGENDKINDCCCYDWCCCWMYIRIDAETVWRPVTLTLQIMIYILINMQHYIDRIDILPPSITFALNLFGFDQCTFFGIEQICTTSIDKERILIYSWCWS